MSDQEGGMDWLFNIDEAERGISRKLSGLVAERFKLPDRGVIRDGAWADLAIFDPQTFGEKGTIFEPNQVATGDRAGAVLRR